MLKGSDKWWFCFTLRWVLNKPIHFIDSSLFPFFAFRSMFLFPEKTSRVVLKRFDLSYQVSKAFLVLETAKSFLVLSFCFLLCSPVLLYANFRSILMHHRVYDRFSYHGVCRRNVGHDLFAVAPEIRSCVAEIIYRTHIADMDDVTRCMEKMLERIQLIDSILASCNDGFEVCIKRWVKHAIMLQFFCWLPIQGYSQCCEVVNGFLRHKFPMFFVVLEIKNGDFWIRFGKARKELQIASTLLR